jgi:hypothetical protein
MSDMDDRNNYINDRNNYIKVFYHCRNQRIYNIKNQGCHRMKIYRDITEQLAVLQFCVTFMRTGSGSLYSF